MDVGTEGEGSHFTFYCLCLFFCNLNIDQLYQVLLKSFKTHWKKLNQNLDRKGKNEKQERKKGTDKMCHLCHVSALPLTAGLLSVSEPL